MICFPNLHSPLHIFPSSSSPSSSKHSVSAAWHSRSRVQISCSLMESHNTEGRRKFMEFPFVSTPHKNLMVGLISAMEDRLDSQLLPCTLPLDVQYYKNQSGTAQASFQIRSGHADTLVDFLLGSWIHCELPTGQALNITSISAYLNRSSDAPDFAIDLIQSGPTTLVLFLDLLPRKDLILWPDYLQTFYEDTKLDLQRQALEKIPEAQPYVSPSLFTRSKISPTAIMVRIETQAGGVKRMEEIMANHLNPISQQVLGIWLDHCACAKRDVGETERAYLHKRDALNRSKTVEEELGSSFPRLFGPEVASRFLESINEYFMVQ